MMSLAEYNGKFGMPEGSYNKLFSNEPLDIPENEQHKVYSIEDKISAYKALWRL